MCKLLLQNTYHIPRSLSQEAMWPPTERRGITVMNEGTRPQHYSGKNRPEGKQASNQDMFTQRKVALNMAQKTLMHTLLPASSKHPECVPDRKRHNRSHDWSQDTHSPWVLGSFSKGLTVSDTKPWACHIQKPNTLPLTRGVATGHPSLMWEGYNQTISLVDSGP